MNKMENKKNEKIFKIKTKIKSFSCIYLHTFFFFFVHEFYFSFQNDCFVSFFFKIITLLRKTTLFLYLSTPRLNHHLLIKNKLNCI
jgi:hypothetical protein